MRLSKGRCVMRVMIYCDVYCVKCNYGWKEWVNMMDVMGVNDEVKVNMFIRRGECGGNVILMKVIEVKLMKGSG